MLYEKDSVSREIEEMIRVITDVFLGKKNTEYEVVEDEAHKSCNALYYRIDKAFQEGKINEAENILFEEISVENPSYLEIAIDFYTKANQKTEEELKQMQFSKEEIVEGMKDIMDMFGIQMI